jgi:signal transduction histidine kinase
MSSNPPPETGAADSASASSPSTLRRLRLGGLLVWLAVGCDTAMTERSAVPLAAPGVRAFWALAFVAFGAAFWLGSSPRARTGRSAQLLVVLQSALALALFAASHNPESAFLLVLVAGQLALLERRAFEAAVLALQTAGTAGLFLAIFPAHRLPLIGVRFPSQALALTGLYLAFQLFADLLCRSVLAGLRARRELLRAYAEVRAARHLLAQGSRLAERVRISRELHDLLGHHLTALSLHLEVASHAEPAARADAVRQARGLAKLLLGDVRAAVRAVGEEPGLDLEAALAALTEEIPRPRIHLAGEKQLRIDDPERAHALLRAVQEIVTNAVRHAGAENLWIELAQTSGGFELRARDDGRGAAGWTAGQGLSGLASRLAELGGSLEIETAAAAGFQVTARLPRAEG